MWVDIERKTNHKMNFCKILFGFSIAVQVYYLYEFVYSIPMRRDNTAMLRRNDKFHETHTQTPQPQLRPIQTTNGNNTALIYKLATTLRAVYPF